MTIEPKRKQCKTQRLADATTSDIQAIVFIPNHTKRFVDRHHFKNRTPRFIENNAELIPFNYGNILQSCYCSFIVFEVRNSTFNEPRPQVQ